MVAEFALANGANINLPSNSKKTLLHYTAQLNQLAMAKLLVEAKADTHPLIIDDELYGLSSDAVVLTLLLGSERPGLSILGWPGEIYLIEFSSNLTGWIGVDEVTNDAGRIEWSEPRGDTGAVQFYLVCVQD